MIGLTGEEVAQRREIYGFNQLDKPKSGHAWSDLFFCVHFILIAIAALLLFWEQNVVGGAICLAFVAGALVVRFLLFKRYREAMLQLNEATARRTVLIRDGVKKICLASEIVPGDVAVLQTGSRIPADGRVLVSEALEIEQTACQEGERCYVGAFVTAGAGTMLVERTGENTLSYQLKGDRKPSLRVQKNKRSLQICLFHVAVIVAMVLVVEISLRHGVEFAYSLLLGIGVYLSYLPALLPFLKRISHQASVLCLLQCGMLHCHPDDAKELSDATVLVRSAPFNEEIDGMRVVTMHSEAVPQGVLSLRAEEMKRMGKWQLAACMGQISNFTGGSAEMSQVTEALKQSGETVAVISEEAIALRAADIGIASVHADDAAKEVACFLLQDGASVQDGIRKSHHLFCAFQRICRFGIALSVPFLLATILFPCLGLMFLPFPWLIITICCFGLLCFVFSFQMQEEAKRKRVWRNPERELSFREIGISILQGFIPFIVAFNSVLLGMGTGLDEASARTIGVGILWVGELLVLLVNLSGPKYAVSLFPLLRSRKVWLPGVIILLVFLVVFITPLGSCFGFAMLSLNQWLRMLGAACVAGLWYEGIKWVRS